MKSLPVNLNPFDTPLSKKVRPTEFIKRVGLIAFSVIVPLLIGHYFFNLKKENKISKSFSLISLCSIIVSMSLAITYEFWNEMPQLISGVSFMVLTHGFLNAIITLPSFFLAIRFEKN